MEETNGFSKGSYQEQTDHTIFTLADIDLTNDQRIS